MIFHKQKFRHDPANGVYGDCFRTALGCLFGLAPDEVPHFYRGREHHIEFKEKQDWLGARGMRLVRCVFSGDCTPDEILYSFGANNTAMYYLLSGTSKTGCNHVVIAYNHEIVHDPSLTDAGIVGPMDHGFYEIEVLSPVGGTSFGKVPDAS